MGEAHARLFVAEGAKVVLTDVLDDLGRAVAEDLGEEARFHHHDVSVPEDWDAVIAFTLRSSAGSTASSTTPRSTDCASSGTRRPMSSTACWR